MKKITMKDIAEMAKVSKTTVSMVLNNRETNISEETRNRVWEIANKYNYIPNSVARSLSTKRTNTIGIILPDITNPFFSEIARAIEDGAGSLGYNVIFCNTDNEEEKEKRYTQLLISKLVDGVIFISGGEGYQSIKVLKDNNIPFVVVDRHIELEEEHYGVYVLNKEGIRRGMEYLYNKGKEKIAFVKGPYGLKTSEERFSGYKECMELKGLYDETLVAQGDFTIEGGIKATEEILNKDKNVDAIFYSNDIMACAGIKYLIKKGIRIPEDISVMGFDNITLASFFEPELTTLAQPIYLMGRESCKMLIDLILENPIDKNQIYFETELIVRETV